MITQALQSVVAANRLRFHVPGHAGRAPEELGGWQPVYENDVTELDELDVLLNPTGCVADSQQALATWLGCAHSFYLTQGSSTGIAAAMLATLGPGQTVLVPRNAHRCVTNGLVLTGATPVWFLPTFLPEHGLWGPVTPQQAEQAYRQAIAQNAQAPTAIVVTSPTYEGLTSPIEALAEWAAGHGMHLIVDEAHGSLGVLQPHITQSAWPESAVYSKVPASIVVQSWHKAGGSLTQTAMAHLPQGSRLKPEAYQRALNLLQTTSPSWPLLASLEQAWRACCLDTARFQSLANAIAQWRETPLPNGFQLLKFAAQDYSKLLITHPLFSAERWGPALEAEHGMAFEAITPTGVLYAVGAGHAPADLHALRQAFAALRLSEEWTLGRNTAKYPKMPLPQVVLSPREAFFRAQQCGVRQLTAARALAEQAVSADVVMRCPPGVPILLPGERVQSAHLAFLSPEEPVACLLGL